MASVAEPAVGRVSDRSAEGASTFGSSKTYRRDVEHDDPLYVAALCLDESKSSRSGARQLPSGVMRLL